MTLMKRILASLLLLVPGTWTDIAGIAIVVLIVLFQTFVNRKNTRTPASAQ